MRTLYYITLAAACLTVFTACSKQPRQPVGGELLASGRWYIETSTKTYDSAGQTVIVRFTDTMPECLKNNFFLFNTDHTITIDENYSKCDTAGPQTYYYGNWQLLNDNTQLSLPAGNGTDQVYRVDKMYLTGLALERTDGTGAVYNIRFSNANILE